MRAGRAAFALIDHYCALCHPCPADRPAARPGPARQQVHPDGHAAGAWPAVLGHGRSGQYNDSVTLLPAAFGVLVLQKAYAVTKAAVTPRLLPSEITLVSANARFNLALAAWRPRPGRRSRSASTSAGGDHSGGAAWVLRVGTAIYLAATILGFRLPDRVDDQGGRTWRRRLAPLPVRTRGAGPAGAGTGADADGDGAGLAAPGSSDLALRPRQAPPARVPGPRPRTASRQDRDAGHGAGPRVPGQRAGAARQHRSAPVRDAESRAGRR